MISVAKIKVAPFGFRAAGMAMEEGGNEIVLNLRGLTDSRFESLQADRASVKKDRQQTVKLRSLLGEHC